MNFDLDFFRNAAGTSNAAEEARRLEAAGEQENLAIEAEREWNALREELLWESEQEAEEEWDDYQEHWRL